MLTVKFSYMYKSGSGFAQYILGSLSNQKIFGFTKNALVMSKINDRSTKGKPSQKKMPKTDTLDALDDEIKHTLNILYRNSEDILKKL